MSAVFWFSGRAAVDYRILKELESLLASAQENVRGARPGHRNITRHGVARPRAVGGGVDWGREISGKAIDQMKSAVRLAEEVAKFEFSTVHENREAGGTVPSSSN